MICNCAELQFATVFFISIWQVGKIDETENGHVSCLQFRIPDGTVVGIHFVSLTFKPKWPPQMEEASNLVEEFRLVGALSPTGGFLY